MGADFSVQIARCMADFGIHLATSLAGKTTEWNGIVLCDPGLASHYRNLAVPLHPVAQADTAEFGGVLAEFYGAHTRWVIWEAFPDDLSAAGLTRTWINPTMWRPGATPLPAVATPAGFRITQVRTNAQVDIFERVRAASYPNAPRPGAPGVQPDSRLLGNEFQLWLGWIGAEPVATGAAFSNGEVNAVKHVTTLEPFRGKRIGAATTPSNATWRPAWLPPPRRR